MGATLVVNPGSSSRKYALYVGGKVALQLSFESSGGGFEVCTQSDSQQSVCTAIATDEFSQSVKRVSVAVKDHLAKIGLYEVPTIVLRVVAPGTYFQRHALIDIAYSDMLRKRSSSAPLHIPVILKELEALQHEFEQAPIVAASDSAFHATMPAIAREYSLPPDEVQALDIHRFGYHGLSVASVVRRIHALIGQDPKRMVVCHIGNGVSVTAVKDGKSVDTTMGFAPATGLVMGSRAGDVDTAALLELMRMKNLRPLEAEMYLHTQGGLAALAGSGDIRQLFERRAHCDGAATKAIHTFIYHLQKAIAQMTVPLSGMDVLVFTATASVRSAELRTMITEHLGHLGIELHPERNEALIGKDGVISTRNSRAKVVVMRTDEMGEMNYVAQELTQQNQQKTDGTINE